MDPTTPQTTGPGPEPEPEPESPAAMAARWNFTISQRFQHILDKSSPHIVYRWIGLSILALIYAVRVYILQGFYLVSYALGIYLLNLLIGFLSPKVDPTLIDDDHGTGTEDGPGPTLPVRVTDEFRPFVRRLPEFLFWYSITKAFCIVFVMTFFSVFDVPVFWPILLFYWVLLLALTLRKQVQHMIKYKYVPFTFGKKRYDKKRAAAEENASLVRD